MTQLQFTRPDQPKNTEQLSPVVYFRGINRIHVNRFKAYTQILSNRLNTPWQITQDIKQANVVVEACTDDKGKNVMRLSVMSDMANLKPNSLYVFDLVFEENKLVRHLNLASKHLLKGFQGDLQVEPCSRNVTICGLLNESLSVLCDLLNQKSENIHFKPSVGIFSSLNNLYREHLLLVVDPKLPDSMRAYQSLVAKKSQGNIIINELIIAIIQYPDEQANEEVFDFIYGNADASTQVTLLNPADERDLESFVKFF